MRKNPGFKFLREGDVIEVLEEYTAIFQEGNDVSMSNISPGDMIQYMGPRERFFGGREGLVYEFMHIPFEEGEPTGEDKIFIVRSVIKLLEGVGYEVK